MRVALIIDNTYTIVPIKQLQVKKEKIEFETISGDKFVYTTSCFEEAMDIYTEIFEKGFYYLSNNTSNIEKVN